VVSAAPKPERKKPDQILERVTVLYEPDTGKVRHVHHTAAIQGAELPSDSALEERALELAARLRGISRDAVRALHVDGADFKPHSRHHVDVAARRVISEPLKRKRRQASE
jgi:hypothetical protein